MNTKNVVSEKTKLKTGYTTGSSATAAAKAALLAIINQQKSENIEILLPKGNLIKIPIFSCKFELEKAVCSVIKNGGDDPDVTHGAEIIVELSFTEKIGEIDIDGGEGIGIVTKPGLGLEINKPAINPVPKKMIIKNLTSVGREILVKKGFRVLISVPKGRELGPKTDNPRLGIKNGISILGTSGIVIPFSTAAYAASIRQNIDVAIAMENDTVVLTTGGRSEDFSKKIVDLPEHCFVQMGDFSGYAIQQCNKKNIKKAYVVGFIGKLVKMAAGVKQTHVKGSKVDMNFLAELAKKSNANEKVIQSIKKANTARHVSEIIQENNVKGFFELICNEVYKHMRKQSENRVSIDVILFNFDGNNDDYAAGAARRYAGGGKSDWYLGSAVEMNILAYWSKGLTPNPTVSSGPGNMTQGGFNINSSDAYWTSSESIASEYFNAWKRLFSSTSNGAGEDHKSFLRYVRPIRAF